MGSLGKTLMENVRALMSYQCELVSTETCREESRGGNTEAHPGSTWTRVSTSGSDTKTSVWGMETTSGRQQSGDVRKMAVRSPECFDHIFLCLTWLHLHLTFVRHFLCVRTVLRD